MKVENQDFTLELAEKDGTYTVTVETWEGEVEVLYTGKNHCKAEEVFLLKASEPWHQQIRAMKSSWVPMLYNKQDMLDDRFSGLQKHCQYDTALPEILLNDIQEVTGVRIWAAVYGYPIDRKGFTEGLIPLDDETEAVIKVYEHIRGYSVRMSGYETFYKFMP